MNDNVEKQAIINAIEKLIESDPTAAADSYSMLDFLEMEDLLSMQKMLLKSKENRSIENDIWFDELCKK